MTMSGGAVSFTLWVRMASDCGTSAPLFRFEHENGADFMELRTGSDLESTNQRVHWVVKSAGTEKTASNTPFFTQAACQDASCHVAATTSSSGAMKVYRNRTIKASEAISESGFGSVQGGDYTDNKLGGGVKFYKGFLWDIRVFNYELNADEINDVRAGPSCAAHDAGKCLKNEWLAYDSTTDTHARTGWVTDPDCCGKIGEVACADGYAYSVQPEYLYYNANHRDPCDGAWGDKSLRATCCSNDGHLTAQKFLGLYERDRKSDVFNSPSGPAFLVLEISYLSAPFSLSVTSYSRS